MSAPPARENLSSPEFTARVQAGEREALESVVRAYLPQILRAARATGLPPGQAEDVTQDTFRTFLESAGRFEGRSQVRTWLFGILYRKVLEARRELSRGRRFESIDDVFEARFDERGSWSRPPKTPDALLSLKEAGEEIADCLGETPWRQRIAFLLRETEGLPSAEICKILDVTATNLGVLLHRLRNRLRECLEGKGVTGIR